MIFKVCVGENEPGSKKEDERWGGVDRDTEETQIV
jgi:hypothetical protein